MLLSIIISLFSTAFIFSTATNLESSSQSTDPPHSSWNDYIVIGDAFRIEFFYNSLENLKSEYALEGLHNTVQAWIDYRRWGRYPSEWNHIQDLISVSHNNGIPIGVVFGYHVGGPVDAPENSPEGFLYYYKNIIPQNEKWRYPNGTLANDPYTIGASRSFGGALVIRVLGQELGRRDFYAIMQPQNPYWKHFLLKWGEKAVDAGADSIFIDDIDAVFDFYWGGGWGCSDTWEGRGLINYLNKTFTKEELEKMGIYNIDHFCLKNYLAKKYGVKGVYGGYVNLRGRFNATQYIETVEFNDFQDVLNDPIFKAAVLYWYKSAISFVRDISEGIRTYASSKGRSVLITNNEFLAWIPQITVTPYMDIIYVEMSQLRPPPYQTNYVISKMAQAAGNYSKKVWAAEWVLWFSNPFKPEQPPNNSSTLLRTLIAQIYSSGAVMLVPFGTGTPSEGWPPQRLVSGTEKESVAKYYRFISENRDLFENTTSLADVALLVSLPTALWNFFPAFDYYKSNEYQKEIYGWAGALERIHVDYDVLLSGMKGVLDTNASNMLNKYKLIIAPQATYISDKDFAALLEYVKIGGKLIVTRNFGLYDDLGNYRDGSVRKKLLSNPNVMILDEPIGLSFENSLENRVIDSQSLNKIQNIVNAQYNKSILINTTGDVVLTIRSNRHTGDILIYLTNHDYHYNTEEDWDNPKSSIPVKVKLPQGYRVKSVEIYSPDFANNKIPIKYTMQCDYLEFKVPSLHTWDIIKITQKTPRQQQLL